MDMAKQRPIKHLMLNTNGIRIAKDKSFAEKLATYMPDFEIYLQLDSFKHSVLQSMRGEDLNWVREKAIEHLNAFNMSTTLVVTLQRGQNDDELGKIIEFALKQKCVRGVTFQPTSVSGRLENFDPATDRITSTEVRRLILEQSPIFVGNDLIPVPCNPDSLIMGYALKLAGEVVPLTRYIDPECLLNTGKNTIVYEQDQELHSHVLKMFSTAQSVDTVEKDLHHLMCCLPNIVAPDLSYNNLFRIIIMNFMDAYDFDVRAIKKSCVHIATPEGKIIPFETMNLFYREEFKSKLEQLKNVPLY
jgi:hypothetical protein